MALDPGSLSDEELIAMERSAWRDYEQLYEMGTNGKVGVCSRERHRTRLSMANRAMRAADAEMRRRGLR